MATDIDKLIKQIDTGLKIEFTEDVPNTHFKKGDVRTINGYTVYYAEGFVCISLTGSTKGYDIPFTHFKIAESNKR